MHPEIEQYQAILSPELPEAINKYLEAPALKRLRGIGLLCGTDYSRLYRHRYFYARYDHSLGAARIVWHFTQDLKQTLAALFHDIATPVFSHSVDFMLGDAATQTSTEAQTRDILAASHEITAALEKDGLTLDDVADYHRYPIADNDSPRLSSDRLEYTISTMLAWYGEWTLDDVREMYDDLCVMENEDGQPELGFASIAMAERFVAGSCRVCEGFLKNDNKVSLQFLGDLLKLAVGNDIVTVPELYTLTEEELIERLTWTRVLPVWLGWDAYVRLDRVHGAKTRPERGYAVQVDVKRRYIDPLAMVGGVPVRASKASAAAKARIDALRAFEDEPVGYIDFDFPKEASV